MTREEAIADIRDNIKPVVGGKSLDMAIKSLEQEPILDKIRAEIIKNSIEDYIYHGCGSDELIIETNEALKIIDKYKAEREE